MWSAVCIDNASSGGYFLRGQERIRVGSRVTRRSADSRVHLERFVNGTEVFGLGFRDDVERAVPLEVLFLNVLFIGLTGELLLCLRGRSPCK